ncbi:MAG: hypothetical protein JWL69_3964 [Phycisphaerales bacterium]|nr:hypothetical protein [Phycisphaerales bacterium]
MTDPQQLSQDLHFVREAVNRRELTGPSPAPILYVWAVYVLVGYTMIDFWPQASGWFFMVGGIVGGILSGILGKRAGRRIGEHDRERGRRAMLHWFGGIFLAFLSVAALAATVPALRPPSATQVLAQIFVVMIGLDYFLAGVHLDRHFLWLGPIVMAGGVLVGLFPHYGWTGLGVVIALGLVVPTFFPAHHAPPTTGGPVAEKGGIS